MPNVMPDFYYIAESFYNQVYNFYDHCLSGEVDELQGFRRKIKEEIDKINQKELTKYRKWRLDRFYELADAIDDMLANLGYVNLLTEINSDFNHIVTAILLCLENPECQKVTEELFGEDEELIPPEELTILLTELRDKMQREIDSTSKKNTYRRKIQLDNYKKSLQKIETFHHR